MGDGEINLRLTENTGHKNKSLKKKFGLPHHFGFLNSRKNPIKNRLLPTFYT